MILIKEGVILDDDLFYVRLFPYLFQHSPTFLLPVDRSSALIMRCERTHTTIDVCFDRLASCRFSSSFECCVCGWRYHFLHPNDQDGTMQSVLRRCFRGRYTDRRTWYVRYKVRSIPRSRRRRKPCVEKSRKEPISWCFSANNFKRMSWLLSWNQIFALGRSFWRMSRNSFARSISIVVDSIRSGVLLYFDTE